jgi:pimeloyl-ACP methyl ester carboxylesterase
MRTRPGHRLAVALALGLSPTVPSRSVGQSPTSNRDSALTTAMVDVDGLAIRVRNGGLARRDPRTPAVIFESGGSIPLETWNSILPPVATFAPVVAYDRSGTGQSAWDSLPPTPERIVARAKRLLTKLGIAPPYVLVGHSWGGALIRYLGGSSPTDVVGMVYLDPPDITQTPAEELRIFESIGAGAAERDAFYAMMDRGLAGAPAAIRAEGAVTLDFFRSDLATRKLPAAPDVPTTVILAGKAPMMPPSGLPFDTRRYADAVQQMRLRRLRDWVRSPGELLVATSSGHMVHVSEPELVIGAIRRLVQLR